MHHWYICVWLDGLGPDQGLVSPLGRTDEPVATTGMPMISVIDFSQDLGKHVQS
jgi:hypothetical protein